MLRPLHLSPCLVFLTAVTMVPAPATGEPTVRTEVRGQNGIVTAGHDRAVEAGIRILEQGGNATDAGVATVLAASVVEIRDFGFGGEAPTMIYDARTREVLVVNGEGPAPKAVTPELFVSKGAIDSNGPLAATIPAVMDAMALALETHGTMRLEQVMQPAIELADGFPMYQHLHEILVDPDDRKDTEKYEWSAKTYFPEGKVPELGGVFRQPNLAKTLRAIVAAEKSAFARKHDRVAAIRAGRDAFYKGAIAHRIADADHAAGGVFTYDDLAGFEGKIEKPFSTNFHGYEVYKAGPWTQGPVLLEVLNILEGIDLKSMGLNSADYLHSVHEAIKLAYDDRDAFYGDPAFAAVPMAGLLSKDYAAGRRALISKEAFLGHRPGDPFPFDHEIKPPATRYVPHAQMAKAPAGGDTTTVAVVDKAGNMFCATPSSGWLYGGAFIAGDTGVPLANHMQSFDLDPASPNALAGGKRPRTTLTPTIVLKDGKPFLAVSAFGLDRQDQQILQVLLDMTVFGMGIQDALEAPRVNSLNMFASMDTHKSSPGVLEVESQIPTPVRDELSRRGHKLKVLDPFGIVTGVVAVGEDPTAGTLRGGADPRHDRRIFGW